MQGLAKSLMELTDVSNIPQLIFLLIFIVLVVVKNY